MSSSYDIDLNGQYLTTFSPDWWRPGGRFAFEGHQYELRAHAWGRVYTLSTGNGAVVARADGVGRKHWTVATAGQYYTFERPSFWTRDQALVLGGQQVGVVRRTGTWSTDVEAHLDGLPLPVQLFVVAVVISMWRVQDSSAGAS